MKKIYFIITLLFLCQTVFGQIINIPDPNFKLALVNRNCIDTDADGIRDSDADTNNDGEIQISEAEALDFLDISYSFGDEISSLEGLQYFVNLEYFSCENNLVYTYPTLDLTSLINLSELNCSINNINTLILTGLTNLTKLNCSRNDLGDIDFSSLTSLQEIDCSYSDITNMNLSNLTSLNVLKCNGNNFSNLDLSGLTNLTQVNTGSITGLTSITYDALPNLESINLDDNYNLPLSELNPTLMPNLKNLSFNRYRVDTSMDLSNFTNLETFQSQYGDEVQSYNFNGLQNLKTIDLLSSYELINMDLANANVPNLEVLILGGNNLLNVNISGLTNLNTFEMNFSNNIETLDMTGCSNLLNLKLTGNDNITLNDVIGLIDIVDLETLNIRHSDFIMADLVWLENLTNLKELNCDNNNFTSLDLSNMPLLEKVTCSNNQLQTLNLTDTFALKSVDCRDNQLTEIIFLTDNETELQTLFCQDNLLQTIDLRRQKYFQRLYADDNPNLESILLKSYSLVDLIYLFVANNSNLSYVCVDTNQITMAQNILAAQGFNNITIDSNCASVLVLDIEDFELANNSISLYPNPTTHSLYVDSKHPIQHISIYDISGRQIQKIAVIGIKTEIAISTETLSTGTYFVKIKTETSEAVKKLIKH